MPTDQIIIFVCEHGAAKSVIAATYFNRLAKERNLGTHAIARGTNPESELSPKTVSGLQNDGLTPTESVPQKLSPTEAGSAEKLVTFCELPNEYSHKTIEHWDNIPPVSEDYQKARDAIVERLSEMMGSL